jgi:hypothetical protein
MTTQLRIFTIKPGSMDTFIQAWLAGVYRLRLEHGFRIDGAWRLDDEERFCWLLSYDGPETFEDKDAAYYASSERVTLHPDPRQYIERVEAYMLTSVLPADHNTRD